jgi:hypothetical protein
MSVMRGSLLLALLAASPLQAEIHGRYVEARTASVFAGACHFGGEVVTRGRDAVMALRIDSGKENGVDLAGTAALAVVTSPTSLRQRGGARRSVLVIDAAPGAQAEALALALRTRYAESLGEIVALVHAPIRFVEKAGTIDVSAPGYAAVSVEALADRACCTMPHLVWYEPLLPIVDSRVGHTRRAEWMRGDVLPAWMDAGENSAFYGEF